ncbi:MAG TPA: DUF11 domain-containing protein [Methanobacteriales archaeon]|nr:MAG: Uncharacterized protein ORF5B [Methanobacteriaceae archaeon 41_258]MBC7096088.1 DUF11 domain-containing protein [Methanobacteriales archaeon]HIH62075.1 DUF11 domain-containing protein [Methanobacteriales archaeon]
MRYMPILLGFVLLFVMAGSASAADAYFYEVNANQTTAKIGDHVQIEITVNTTPNNESYSVDNMTVQTYITPRLKKEQATVDYGTYENGTWYLGDDYYGMATLTLNCLVNGTGTLTGHFYIRANNDENWTNNYARIDIDVPFTDLKSTARVPGSLSPGQTFNYTVTVVNMGVENATNTQMQINLPSNVEYQSHTATKGTFNPQTGIWTIGTLTYNNDDNESDDALGENATLVLTLKVKPDSAAGTYNITTNTTCDLSLLSIFQASPTTALRITDTNKIQLIISNPTGVRQRHVIYITIIDGSKTIKRSYNFYLGAGGTRTISLGNLHRNATIKITQYTYNAERTAKTIQYTQKLKSIAHENSKTTTVQKVKGRQRQAIKRITRATINNQFQIVYT